MEKTEKGQKHAPGDADTMKRLVQLPYPSCCSGCLFLDWEWSEYTDITFYYCIKNIWWPWRKQTCKKRKTSVAGLP